MIGNAKSIAVASDIPLFALIPDAPLWVLSLPMVTLQNAVHA